MDLLTLLFLLQLVPIAVCFTQHAELPIYKKRHNLDVRGPEPAEGPRTSRL